jgi:hypothetical protein
MRQQSKNIMELTDIVNQIQSCIKDNGFDTGSKFMKILRKMYDKIKSI